MLALPQYLLTSPLIDAFCACVIPPDHRWVQVELRPGALWQLADESPLGGIVPAMHRTHRMTLPGGA